MECDRLLQSARGGSYRAWLDLQDRVLQRLVWIVRKKCKHLASWEVEEVCVEALEIVTMKPDSLPNWNRAWAYAIGTARHLALKHFRLRSDPEARPMKIGQAKLDPLDPQAGWLFEELDVIDSAESFTRTLNDYDKIVFAEMIDQRGVTLDTSQVLGVSMRTVRRRASSIRNRMKAWLNDPLPSVEDAHGEGS